MSLTERFHLSALRHFHCIGGFFFDAHRSIGLTDTGTSSDELGTAIHSPR